MKNINIFSIKNFILLLATIVITGMLMIVGRTTQHTLPIVAIANYGPHASLSEAIDGLKQGLVARGFVEGKTVHYEEVDVGFDSSLIPQMIAKLKNMQPKVIVVVTTPVALFTKNQIKIIPVVFSVITDPVEAGLIKNPNKSEANITGASEKQNPELLLSFIKQLLVSAKKVGVLYSTSEANDLSMIKTLRTHAISNDMQIVAVPVDAARDVPVKMQGFKGKVDVIYVGTSGPIQPTLPAIVAEADKMNIPVVNADKDAVYKHQVLASFGVDYAKIGINTAELVSHILNGKPISELQPIYPGAKDHSGFVSAKRASMLNLKHAPDLDNTTIIE